MELSKIQAIFGISAIIVGWVAVFWKGWSESQTRLNNVGSRVNETVTIVSTHAIEIANLKLEQQRSSDDRNSIRERSAANMQAIEAIRAELSEERITVVTMIHNNEKASAERNAQLREQLARISERLDIERIVNVVVRQTLAQHAKD